MLAYDFKTGKRIWATTIADPKYGELVPSAPIAAEGLVFVGNAGGDFKGGKGHMFALDAKTGKIVWEFFLVPKVEGDTVRGPLGATPLDASNWKNAPGIPISGGGTWTTHTLDTKTGLLYVPGGNPAPDFVVGVREGDNSFSDLVVVLDAKTGNYKNHFQVVKKDWHDWDVSNPPILIFKPWVASSLWPSRRQSGIGIPHLRIGEAEIVVTDAEFSVRRSVRARNPARKTRTR